MDHVIDILPSLYFHFNYNEDAILKITITHQLSLNPEMITVFLNRYSQEKIITLLHFTTVFITIDRTLTSEWQLNNWKQCPRCVMFMMVVCFF